jgi:hypothetical protein
MRSLLLLLPLALAGCASAEYRDTNAAVDADPLCASQPDGPNDPVALRCERQSTVELKRREAEPLDLKREGRDTPPR